ncbi:MAG: recombinase family protein [Ruminococcaceae bacterium]|nr:recombinase family protein [Oscillospiraceae bacterium]
MAKKRVCAYVRLAPHPMPGTPDTRALPAYYEALIKQNKEWEFVGVYVEAANSISTKRPELDRLVTDCKDHKIDIIMVHHLSVINHNLPKLKRFIDEMKELGVTVISETEDVEKVLRTATMARNMTHAMEARELELAEENVPFGYKLVDGELVIDEFESKIAKYVFDKNYEYYMNPPEEIIEGILAEHANDNPPMTREKAFEKARLSPLIGHYITRGIYEEFGDEIREWAKKQPGASEIEKQVKELQGYASVHGFTTSEPIISPSVYERVQRILNKK